MEFLLQLTAAVLMVVGPVAWLARHLFRLQREEKELLRSYQAPPWEPSAGCKVTVMERVTIYEPGPQTDMAARRGFSQPTPMHLGQGAYPGVAAPREVVDAPRFHVPHDGGTWGRSW